MSAGPSTVSRFSLIFRSSNANLASMPISAAFWSRAIDILMPRPCLDQSSVTMAFSVLSATVIAMVHQMMEAPGKISRNQNQGWRYQGATGVSVVINQCLIQAVSAARSTISALDQQIGFQFQGSARNLSRIVP